MRPIIKAGQLVGDSYLNCPKKYIMHFNVSITVGEKILLSRKKGDSTPRTII